MPTPHHGPYSGKGDSELLSAEVTSGGDTSDRYKKAINIGEFLLVALRPARPGGSAFELARKGAMLRPSKPEWRDISRLDGASGADI